MEQSKAKLAREIRIFLEVQCIDPIYVITIVGFLIVLSNRKGVQNWKEIAGC